ncbi:hypothetical protein [Bradyrhizobium japonicum]|uniref:hypothetical protein n=1 Tax=Bradyrhizobium japonicum TaxID=375 RepID=UPI001BAB1EEA|nr:hypothetical protein [Bradyrhizobium japonicum]MBR0761568.1 hypothetical protein [Bradyrhizobium japonicum]
MHFPTTRHSAVVQAAPRQSPRSELTVLKQWLADQRHELMLMLAPAIHEAGHVFAARAHGFEVAWVSLDPDFLMNNPLAIENKCASGEPVAMVIAAPRIRPIHERGCVISRAEWDAVDAYVLECMAGPMAEASFNPHFQIEVAERDKLQANALLWRVAQPSKFKFRSKVKQILRKAYGFVEQNREEIFFLGVMIHNRRTILGSEIDSAIHEAKRLAVLERSGERMEIDIRLIPS